MCLLSVCSRCHTTRSTVRRSRTCCSHALLMLANPPRIGRLVRRFRHPLRRPPSQPCIGAAIAGGLQVRFQVYAPEVPASQSLYVSGSSDVLGSWTPSAAIKLSDAEYVCVWYCVRTSRCVGASAVVVVVVVVCVCVCVWYRVHTSRCVGANGVVVCVCVLTSVCSPAQVPAVVGRSHGGRDRLATPIQVLHGH